MAARTADCRKFTANIFNKSKCSHCFRQREEHSAAALECNRVSSFTLFLFCIIFFYSIYVYLKGIYVYLGNVIKFQPIPYAFFLRHFII